MTDSNQIYSVCVVGAGLAGTECAWQMAKRGVDVVLVEMRPQKMTLAHHGAGDAELVCSNSFRSNDISNAVGLIKEEMASLDSLMMRAAYHAKVPAGGALAVDRDVFSDFISKKLSTLESIKRVANCVVDIEQHGTHRTVIFEDGSQLSAKHVVLATGPLTDEKLADWIKTNTGSEYLYFYDAIAPIIEKDSIDFNVVFQKDRYDKGDGDGDYINCPMNKEQYEAFIENIQNAELAPVKDFDQAQFFDGCLPIEEMVRRGPETLRYGPLKPVGLGDKELHAVVQLRQDNLHGSLYNMVGFQTRMKWGDQKRIFQTIPGLEKAEFVRMGSMHRNTYVCSPQVLKEGLEMQNFEGVHLAGQITGCEGYVESSAMGLNVALYLSKVLAGQNYQAPPRNSALGALVHHILKADPNDYQPMNINFGLFDPIEGRYRKLEKKLQYVKRAAHDFRAWMYEMDF